MRILKWALLLWITIYLGRIARSIANSFSIRRLLEALIRFIESGNIEDGDYSAYLNRKADFEKNKGEILLRVPAINRRLTYGCKMDYDKSDEENYNAAINAYNSLLMHQAYAVDNILQSFNPLAALKTLLQIPSFLLGYLGARPKNTFSKLFNIVVWIIVYLLNMFQGEIKTLLMPVFHKFTGA